MEATAIYATGGGAPIPVLCGGLSIRPVLKGGPTARASTVSGAAEGGFGLLDVYDHGNRIDSHLQRPQQQERRKILAQVTVPVRGPAPSNRRQAR